MRCPRRRERQRVPTGTFERWACVTALLRFSGLLCGGLRSATRLGSVWDDDGTVVLAMAWARQGRPMLWPGLAASRQAGAFLTSSSAGEGYLMPERSQAARARKL